MDNMMIELEKELRSKTKNELIMRQPEIIKKCQQITSRHALTSLVAGSSANLNDFVSEIVPSYDSSTFTIKNFSQLKLKADAIYSPPLNVLNRLKYSTTKKLNLLKLNLKKKGKRSLLAFKSLPGW